jgi:hypothetical protein
MWAVELRGIGSVWVEVSGGVGVAVSVGVGVGEGVGVGVWVGGGTWGRGGTAAAKSGWVMNGKWSAAVCVML